MDTAAPHAQGQCLRELINGGMHADAFAREYAARRDVAELEARLAGCAGARHCVAFESGVEALVLAFMALRIGPGDEVITSPFASGVAVEAIRLRDAVPVFVDIDRATCNIDSSLIEARITPRTRAIVPVSLYGQPADMEEINAIARRHALAVVEDARESFGATYCGKPSCNLADVGCTSFQSHDAKGGNGEAGALFTSDTELAHTLRALRLHRGAGRAIGQQQCRTVHERLDRLQMEVQRRQRVAAGYDALFSGRLQRIGRVRDRTSTFAHYGVVLEERDRIQAELDAQGIPTALYPPALHLRPAYRYLDAAASCPVATQMAAMVLNLPMGPDMDEAGCQRVATAVLRAARVQLPGG